MKGTILGFYTDALGNNYVGVSFFNGTTFDSSEILLITQTNIQAAGLLQAGIDAAIAHAAIKPWTMVDIDFTSQPGAAVAQSSGSTSQFLRGDGAWATPAGGSEAFPVGSVFISVVSTNPATLLGYGTWSAFGAGRVMVGIDAGQTEFDTVEEVGGAKTHTLQTTEIPAHTHVLTELRDATTGGSTTNIALSADASSTTGTKVSGSTGGGGAHNNLQPYIVCYFWKRTA